jgi:hypothetical protein
MKTAVMITTVIAEIGSRIFLPRIVGLVGGGSIIAIEYLSIVVIPSFPCCRTPV